MRPGRRRWWRRTLSLGVLYGTLWGSFAFFLLVLVPWLVALMRLLMPV